MALRAVSSPWTWSDIEGPMALPVWDLWAFLCQRRLAVEALWAVSSPRYPGQFSSRHWQSISSFFFIFNSARSTQVTWWFTPTDTVLLRQGKLEKKRCKACGAVWLRRHYAQQSACSWSALFSSMHRQTLSSSAFSFLFIVFNSVRSICKLLGVLHPLTQYHYITGQTLKEKVF